MLLEGYQTSPDVDDCPGSVHTLLYDTSVTPITDLPNIPFGRQPVSVLSSSTPRKRSPPQRQYSSESNESIPEKSPQKSRSSAQQGYQPPQLNMTYTISPDISTSSLVSASEHYNGGSLVNDNVCSPQTSNSSPDTPEWSLIDSFHKGGKNNHDSPSKKPLLASREKDEEEADYDDPYTDLKEIDSEDSINSKGNKVIITIGHKSGSIVAKESTSDSQDLKLETNMRRIQNHEYQRRPSWTQLTGTEVGATAKINESAERRQCRNSPPLLNLNTGIQEDEEDINYPYATPYSPSQETRNVRNPPYVPPPVFALPAHETLPSDGVGNINQQVDIEGSPLSIGSEESDLESIHSYHPPAKVIDIPSAKRLATRLYQLDGFRKIDVSRHLSRNNEYNQGKFI